jgi:hypothetical protein
MEPQRRDVRRRLDRRELRVERRRLFGMLDR